MLDAQRASRTNSNPDSPFIGCRGSDDSGRPSAIRRLGSPDSDSVSGNRLLVGRVRRAEVEFLHLSESGVQQALTTTAPFHLPARKNLPVLALITPTPLESLREVPYITPHTSSLFLPSQSSE